MQQGWYDVPVERPARARVPRPKPKHSYGGPKDPSKTYRLVKQ